MVSCCTALGRVGRLQGQLLRRIGIASKQCPLGLSPAAVKAQAANARPVPRAQPSLLPIRERGLSTLACASVGIGDLVEMEVCG